MQLQKKLSAKNLEDKNLKPLQNNPGVVSSQLSDLDKIIFKIREQKAKAKTFMNSYMIPDQGQRTIYLHNRPAG